MSTEGGPSGQDPEEIDAFLKEGLDKLK